LKFEQDLLNEIENWLHILYKCVIIV
jgi:hypothetical protein